MFARVGKLGVVLAVGALVAVGCEDEGTGVTPPTVDEVAGQYAADEDAGLFETVEQADTTDMLAEGATIALTLDDDGSASGELLIPGAGQGGEDLEVDLAGGWDLDGFVVTLDVDAGSFFDGLELTWLDGVLSAEGEMSEGVDFELELEEDAGS